MHEEKAKTRMETFESILQNQPTKSSWIEHFYSFAIILISFFLIVPFSCLPAHDLITHPEMWYEILFHGTYFAIINNLFWTCLAGSLMNLSHFYQVRSLVITSTVGVITIILFTISTYYFWTHVLFYQYPIPFSGQVTVSIVLLSLFPTLWRLMPYDLRKNLSIWRRFKFFFCYVITNIIFVSVYQFLLVLIATFQGPYQPLIGFIVIVTRELYIWILTKIVKNCPNGDEAGALIVLCYACTTYHSIIMCYMIGSATTDFTAWVLMGFDFLINIYTCLRIVWMKHKSPMNLDDQRNLLQDLAMAELVEFHAPVAFILITLLAYFTPIGEIIGNISNGYWHNNAIEDIAEALWKMGFFVLADLTSLLASATILWFSCKINLWSAFIVIQKEFFHIFSLILGYMLLAVSE